MSERINSMNLKTIFTLPTLLLLSFLIPASADLIGYWDCNPGSGTIIEDKGPNHLDGYFFNENPLWVTDEKDGFALELKYRGDFFFISQSIENYYDTAFSVAGWIKPKQLDQWNLIFSDWSLRMHNAIHFSINNRSVRLDVSTDGSNGTPYLAGTTKLETNKWYHVVGTYRSGIFNVYVNGSKDADELVTERPTAGIFKTGLKKCFGVKNSVLPEYNFVGILDEIMLFNHELSPQEVKTIYGLSTRTETKNRAPMGAVIRQEINAQSIRFTYTRNSLESRPSFSIYSLKGELVYSDSLPASRENAVSFTWNLQNSRNINVTNGTYLLRIDDAQRVVSSIFTISR